MEHLKPIGEYYEPDPRMDGGNGLTLESLYRDAASHLELHAEVPEDVRSYFNSVVTLWLYGYLYYPFFALAQTMGLTALEMALKRRSPEMAGQTLRPLLEHAVANGILSDDGYPRLGLARQNAEALMPFMNADSEGPRAQPANAYTAMLASSIPHLRNAGTHPHLQIIVTPDMALDLLIVATETINQLWPRWQP